MDSTAPADLEVGRFALRTFKIQDNHLSSIVANGSGQHWENGTCKARCVLFDDGAFVNEAHLRMENYGTQAKLVWTKSEAMNLTEYLQHEAPRIDCQCGVYGSLNLENIRRQYGESLRMLAVIAAEGRTIIGTRGLRTEFARIVAYWTAPFIGGKIKRITRHDVPDATHYKDLKKMLAEYGIPETGSALEPTHTNSGYWWMG